MKGIHAPTLVAMGLAAGLASGASMRALLIDGPPDSAANSQTAAFKGILESSGLFQVDVVTTPAKGASPGTFQTQFERYKVIVLNYGGDAWPVNSLAALDKYLQNGGGLVVLPAGGAAFPAWPEYNLMIGLSNAGNRNQSAGPLWFYKDGNLAFDSAATSQAGKSPHPNQPFQVTIRYTEHPITKGVPLVWMHAADDLAGNLRGPGKNMAMLATALSDPEKGGTGRDEPQLLALTYGKGHVFHTFLGSTTEGMACAGFQVMLQRGAEWAATGKVTQKIPADFPGEDKVSIRK